MNIVIIRMMEKNILDSSANDLMALAVTFCAYIGNLYETDDLAILSGFFNVIGDGLSLYSAVLAKKSSNDSEKSEITKKE